ncbi:carbonic anhydrase 13-like [Chelonus insularis]|uniref:carbonic anhydrase 13-like n=1 Tax=Chelonus insularis TaxID=460826 RepID=UPI00158DE255|nr:carbonic anhydrase 13-like [Chelonus insularis]
MAMIMNNDGITVSIRGFWSTESKPHIEGGLLKGRYYFHSITFHWKSFHNDGSEHSFDNIKYPLEMQVMHVKENFKSLSEAMQRNNTKKDNNNIAIISYIFQIKDQKNALLEPILMNLSRVEKTYSKVYIPPIHLDSVLPLFESKYYSYKGSLTQPPYCEIVTWIIHPEPLVISSLQMAEFCNLHSTNGLMIRNSRSIQSLNDRNVFFIENN